MKKIGLGLPSRGELRGRRMQIRGKIRERMGKLRHSRTAQARGKFEQARGTARIKISRIARRTKSRL